jgi:rhamnose transport system permease protein
MGNSADAATFAGINVARTKFWLYVVSGTISALAGVFWTLRFASARADNGTGLELSVVAAVLLGGVSIFGGRGGPVGVLAAVILLGVLNNALQLAYVPANTLTIVTGALLIASVVGPNVLGLARERWRRRRRSGVASAASPSAGG